MAPNRPFRSLSGAGFFLGLSPRIASILAGETSRGGQGFDVDINFRARSIGTSKMNLKILYILVLFIIKRNFSKYAL